MARVSLARCSVECGGKLIRMLLYADMMLMVTCPVDMQKQLDLLYESV